MLLLAMTCVTVFSTGCKKKSVSQAPHPQSAEAVILALIEQGKLLNDAAARTDFKYIHDYTYYFQSLADALASKLNASQKLEFDRLFNELKTITDQLDASSGRKHAEATQTSMTRLSAILAEMEKRFLEMKQADPALSGKTAYSRLSPLPRLTAKPGMESLQDKT